MTIADSISIDVDVDISPVYGYTFEQIETI